VRRSASTLSHRRQLTGQPHEEATQHINHARHTIWQRAPPGRQKTGVLSLSGVSPRCTTAPKPACASRGLVSTLTTWCALKGVRSAQQDGQASVLLCTRRAEAVLSPDFRHTSFRSASRYTRLQGVRHVFYGAVPADALFGHNDGVEPLLSYPAALFGGPVIERWLGPAWAPLKAPSLLRRRRCRHRQCQQHQRVRLSALCLAGQK
jgi:hypothetical protein